MESTVYIATSVDGFIARENGSIDWLPSGGESESEDYGYQDFMNSVDALIMGRNTYEMVLSFGDWPYGKKPVVVLSSQQLEVPERISDTVSIMCATPGEIVQQLTEQGYQHLYIDGGKTIQEFMREGLIQNLIITKIPILIGSGIPLFGALPQDIRLHHIETIQFENGLVQSKYKLLNQ
ncbi:MAG: dihydrofolate reductase [Anaerolineaceae bacterium]|nr:dihydrofolate reductase [Anaerolineaceae bacterium]